MYNQRWVIRLACMQSALSMRQDTAGDRTSVWPTVFVMFAMRLCVEA